MTSRQAAENTPGDLRTATVRSSSAAISQPGVPAPRKCRVTTAVGYSEGMLVDHEKYGRGRITEVSGHGAMRKLRIRFSSGERAFIADKAKLTVVKNG